MAGRLTGKVAIVTGAASGIGRSVAPVFAREGCHLALIDINEAGLNEEIGAHNDDVEAGDDPAYRAVRGSGVSGHFFGI